MIGSLQRAVKMAVTQSQPHEYMMSSKPPFGIKKSPQRQKR